MPGEAITEDSVYAGFNPLARGLLRGWKEYILDFPDQSATVSALRDADDRLQRDNIVIFFDHHYAFDALPASLALGKTLQNIVAAILPYAVHLDMGVNPEGAPSIRYALRTRGFHWLMRNIREQNPSVEALGVVRAFELENPALREIVDEKFAGANQRYVRTFIERFTRYDHGLACVLSPMAGLAFPDRTPLDPSLYKLLDRVARRREQPLAYYFIGAYPSFHASRHYFAPLLTKHRFAARGPAELPADDYEAARDIVAHELRALREAGGFELPDYDRLRKK